jgi:heptosyltransferase-2
MKVLIIRFSSMGDVILTAPLFSFLKERSPDAELCFVTHTLYTDFFRDDPRLSSVVACSRDNVHAVFSELAKQHWDMIVDLQNNRRSRSIRNRYFRGVKQGLFNKLHMKRLLLLYARINAYKRQSSVAERYIQVAHGTVGPEIDIPPVKLYFKNEELSRRLLVNTFGRGRQSVIALIPFSSWKNKQWSLSSYTAVGTHFIQKDWKVILLGGPEDRDEAKRLESTLGKNCCSFAGKMSLYEAGGLIKLCRLVLGNDTGLTHLARSCGVKTGIIYGATTSHFGFFPYGEPPFKIFQVLEFCRPCHPHGGNFCWRISRPCLRNIKDGDVIEGLEVLNNPDLTDH